MPAMQSIHTTSEPDLSTVIRAKQIELLRAMLGDQVQVVCGRVVITCDDGEAFDATDRLDFMLEARCTLSATDADDIRDLLCCAFSIDAMFEHWPVTLDYGN